MQEGCLYKGEAVSDGTAEVSFNFHVDEHGDGRALSHVPMVRFRTQPGVPIIQELLLFGSLASQRAQCPLSKEYALNQVRGHYII